MAVLYTLSGLLVCLVAYIAHLQRSFNPPSEAVKIAQKRWTVDSIRKRYDEIKDNFTDVKPSLPPKTGRRYVVVGGSGLWSLCLATFNLTDF